MTESAAILELLLAQARAGDQAALGRLLELTAIISGCGPLADPPAAAGPARCLRPGPGDVPEGAPRVRAVRRLGGAGAGCLAPADPGPDPGQPGQAPPRPGARPAPAGIARRAAGPLEPGDPGSNWPTRSPRRAPTPSGASRPSCWPTPWPACPPTIARSSSCVTWSKSRSTRSPRGWAARPTRCASSGDGPWSRSSKRWRDTS